VVDTSMSYRLTPAGYGKPDVLPLQGETRVDAIDGRGKGWPELSS
jgi:hypothetical protein